MATQSKTNPITDYSVEAATERVSEFGQKAAESSKQASEAYLASYEKAVVTLADTYEKAAGATKIDWIASISNTQADTAREVARAYTGAARNFVS
jgi:hypothetical protein